VLDVTIERDVPATMRDGFVLWAEVYRPATGGP
jgi:predicted acyl esterase